jgi:hypothetical protein
MNLLETRVEECAGLESDQQERSGPETKLLAVGALDLARPDAFLVNVDIEVV